MPKSPIKKDPQPSTASSNAESDLDSSLRIYRIHRADKCDLPNEIKATIGQWRLSTCGDVTPKSKSIAAKAPWLRQQSESTALSALAKYLGREHADFLDGTPTVCRQCNEQWLAGCIPVPDTLDSVHQQALQTVKTPPTPYPDISYGYTFETFTVSEKDKLQTLHNRRRVFLTARKEPVFPYFIQQWKLSAKGGTLYAAETQAMRDGAAAVAALQTFYEAFDNHTVSIKDTMCFSLITEMNMIRLMVHWRKLHDDDSVSWECNTIQEARISVEEDVVSIRRFVDCIFAWAIDTRLLTISKSLEHPESAASTRTADQTIASNTADSRSWRPFQSLPTPSTESSTKRPRVED